MELDGIEELRRMGTGILELAATLMDGSKVPSMEGVKGSLLVEVSLEVVAIGGKMDVNDLVSIPCATFGAATGFSVSPKFSLSWGKTAFSFTFWGIMK